MDKAPLGSFGFRVSLGGGDLSLFQEVSGLGVQINVKDQPGGESLLAEPLRYANHGDLNDIRRCSLNGRVHGNSLAE